MNKIIKYSLCLLFIAAIICGCKKENNKGTDNDNVKDAIAYMPQKDTKLTYKITAGDETGTIMTQTISKFRDSAGYRVADYLIDIAGIKQKSIGLYNQDKTITYNETTPIYLTTVETIIKHLYNSAFTHTEAPMIMVVPHQNQKGATVFQETISAQWRGVNIDPEEPHDKTEGEFSITAHKGTIADIEKITTSMGTFDCLKIEYTVTQKQKNALNGKTLLDNSNEFQLTIWLAKGIGTVKSREINLSSGAITETELTKIES